MPKALVAMSGGVDSSIAAWLLKQQGYEVEGLFMLRGSAETGCGNHREFEGLRRVAAKLDVPVAAIDFTPQFDALIEEFIDTYLSGRTPNPCIVCNMRNKFGLLFDEAERRGADVVATGHYARIVHQDGQAMLCRGLDPGKDQAYSLFGIRRDRLARLTLPIGERHKSEIREIAAQLDLPNADKPDSMEICFIPEQNHTKFIHEHRPGLDTSGPLVTTDGTVVGHHNGIERFTIGQRKGIGVALGEPHYVVRIEPEANRVVIGREEELACKVVMASGANWLIDPPTESFRCQIKIRYRSQPVDATVEPISETAFRADFDEHRYGIAPGQAAVCFDGDRVLGGGWID